MKRDKAILHVVPLYYQKEEAEYIRNKRIITLYAWLHVQKGTKKCKKKVNNGLLVTVFENYRNVSFKIASEASYVYMDKS